MYLTLFFNAQIGYESMDSIYDKFVLIRSTNPFEAMSSFSDHVELDEDIASLILKRDNHFDHLMAVYQEEKCNLRDRIDKLHLDVQSLRVQ